MAVSTLRASFLTAFAAPGSDFAVPPSEFLIFAYGKTETTKGVYFFDESAATAVLKAAEDYGNRLTIDYEHQALSDPPVQAPAAGRYRLELRADGLYAVEVEWTPDAKKYLSNKEYLYYSPAFIHDDKGRPSRLLNVALTNLPATKNMKPLVAAKQDADGDGDEDDMKKCSSCSKDMADGDALFCSMCSGMKMAMSQVVTLTGKSNADEALATIQAWKLGAEECVQLRATLEQQKVAAESALFDSEIAAAKTGALLAPSDEHKRNKAALAYKGKAGAVDSLRSFLSALDPLVGQTVAIVEPAKVPDALGLTDEEKRVAAKMNISLDALAANKKRRLELAANPTKVVPLTPDEEDAA